MLVFKKVDAYGQLVLIVAGLIFSVAVQDEIFILSYFVVGGWQVLSALIHLLGFSKKPILKGRKWYLFTLLFLVIAGVLSAMDSESTIIYLVGLLLISPLLAVWYCVISFREVRLWENDKSPVAV